MFKMLKVINSQTVTRFGLSSYVDTYSPAALRWFFFFFFSLKCFLSHYIFKPKNHRTVPLYYFLNFLSLLLHLSFYYTWIWLLCVMWRAQFYFWNIWVICFSQTYILKKCVFSLGICQAFQGLLVVKNPPASAGVARDLGSIPGLGRSSGV